MTFIYHAGNTLQGRYLKIARPMTPRNLIVKDNSNTIKPAGCKTIFIKNLPYDCTEEQIRENFMLFGKISSVRLAAWGHTQQLKGFGYIEFKSEQSTEIAVKKSGTVNINGRIISADYETGTPKGSFRGADGKAWKKTSTETTKKRLKV